MLARSKRPVGRWWWRRDLSQALGLGVVGVRRVISAAGMGLPVAMSKTSPRRVAPFAGGGRGCGRAFVDDLYTVGDLDLVPVDLGVR